MAYICSACEGPMPHKAPCDPRPAQLSKGLAHVRRFILGAEHEDDCPALERKMCLCGKVLAREQVEAAMKFIKRTN